MNCHRPKSPMAADIGSVVSAMADESGTRQSVKLNVGEGMFRQEVWSMIPLVGSPRGEAAGGVGDELGHR